MGMAYSAAYRITICFDRYYSITIVIVGNGTYAADVGMAVAVLIVLNVDYVFFAFLYITEGVY